MRPKTCYCQQQSSQYPIFPSQARDQSFTRVARNETKYQKILDAADFARRENCSFIRLNDAFRKTLLKAAKKALRQPTIRAEFSLILALISKWHTERIMGSYEKHFVWGEGGNKLRANEKLINVYLLWPIRLFTTRLSHRVYKRDFCSHVFANPDRCTSPRKIISLVNSLLRLCTEQSRQGKNYWSIN